MFLKSYWFVNLALYPAKKVVLYTTFSRFKCKKFILGQAKLQSSSKGQVMDIKIWFFFLEPFQWPEFPWRWEGTDACRSSGTRMTRAHPNQIRLQWRRSSVGPNNPCLMLPRTIIMWNMLEKSERSKSIIPFVAQTTTGRSEKNKTKYHCYFSLFKLRKLLQAIINIWR